MNFLSVDFMKAIILLSYILKPDGTLAEIAKERVDAALELFAKNKYDKIIISGGTSGFEKEKTVSESEALKEYLTVNRIDENLIINEEKSKDTIGNAIFTKKIIDKEKMRNITVITSDFHFERAKYVFDFIFGGEYNLQYDESKTKNKSDELIKNERESLELVKLFLNKNTKKENLESLLYKFHPFYMEKDKVKDLLKLSEEELSRELGIEKPKTILYRKFIEKYLEIIGKKS